MTAVRKPMPRLIDVLCPVCKPRKNIIVRAAPGSVVEAYCRHCKFRKVIVVA